MATTATARKPRKSAAPKADPYQVITDQIISLLDAGTAPWHQPWDKVGGAPLSMSTKRPYRGINVLLLQIAALDKGYGSSWWGTYNQIEARGGQVRKGERGTQIVLWRPLLVDNPAKPGEKKQIFMLKTYSVFNAEQADGDLGLPKPVERPQVEAIADCEQALTAYYATGPSLGFGGDSAHYNKNTDHVQMPPRVQFHSAAEYYGTLFHETVHSTGHESRLARKDLLDAHYFGDPSYSKEELTAEMGAAMLAGLTGIAAATLPASASYLAHWVKVLKDDRKLIVQAAAQAQKACDLILGTEVHQVSDDKPVKNTGTPAATAVAA